MRTVSFVAVVTYQVHDDATALTVNEAEEALIQGLEEGRQYKGKIIRHSVSVATARVLVDRTSLKLFEPEISKQRHLLED